MKEGMFTMKDLDNLQGLVNDIRILTYATALDAVARFQIRAFRAGVREGMRKAKWQTVVGFPQTLLPGRGRKG